MAKLLAHPGRVLVLMVLCSLVYVTGNAQKIQYSRAYDQTGIHTFEPSKDDATPYEGFKLQIGGSFTQGFQMLTHENYDGKLDSAKKYGALLYPLGNSSNFNGTQAKLNGFNLAAANLNLNVQLGDGIRIFLENYMASRHHNEFWVKGGFIQIDKLPMFGNPEWYTKYFRVKIGHMEVNYGDTHFRRTDGGNAIFNAFGDNNIMDQFTTEIGGEVYIYPVKDFMFMLGLTNGLIRNDIKDYAASPTIGSYTLGGVTTRYDSITAKTPTIYLKGAYDKQFNQDLRFRLSASYTFNGAAPRSTLYGGDRTGSAYFGVLEAGSSSNGTAEAFSGRYNPGLSNKFSAIMINPFLKWKGLEIFGTYEVASGNSISEVKTDGNGSLVLNNGKPQRGDDRTVTQIAFEGVYRFLKNEQLFIGARYNQVTGTQYYAPTVNAQGVSTAGPNTFDITISRISVAAGWFPTKNLLLKAEYVTQTYDGFPKRSGELRNAANFGGLVIQAVVGF